MSIENLKTYFEPEDEDYSKQRRNRIVCFSDGNEFGFGAEIGISTQKMHARGPMALPELTTYKYKIYGKGQIR